LAWASDEFVIDALDSLNDHLGSRVAFLEVVFRDFEGCPHILGANCDSDAMRAD
jgi:hypothetical protein